MARVRSRRIVLWLLVVISFIAGAVWFVAGWSQAGIELLYLAIGVINLVAGVVWSLNLGSSFEG